ncbi:Abi family protein [Lactobacillus intestinalis]|uniref:Abortive infection bacteriophage resistance protein n=1 Tax=Lactobacillus intestinalis DSM 6629 TaxID=1423761 RepID=A0ABR5PM88_9LACO|nr:Abi family protein [Lactobacillus intestinalis]KRM31327.1 abortive infection bacteriophage resistance protein [Lactobacillus intestinalis DSM 6629]UTW40118.1 Abi family protein [Lactobacillus intestinalis]
MKEFKTIDEQIMLLKARGLTFNNIDHAKKYLKSNNYYNIINGYSKYFQESQDQFISGTTFDEVSQLYFCDKQLKQAFFNAIINVEHHLKSIFAYNFAQEFDGKRYACLDINSYNPNKVLTVGRTISDLTRVINFYKNKPNTPIYHYVKKYDDVPIWVIVEFLDFGQLCSLIKNSKRTVQNNICKDLLEFITDNIGPIQEHFTPEIMMSFIENIRELRNICAHNNRLLKFRCRADSKYFASLDKLSGVKNTDSRKYAYSVLISMQCFLSPTEYRILSNTIRKKLNFLSNHLSSIKIDEILSAMGFPNDWLENPKFRQ